MELLFFLLYACCVYANYSFQARMGSPPATEGSYLGECITYHIDNSYKWIPMKLLCDHTAKINYISISDEMKLFATASDDGSVNLYNTGAPPRLIRCFRHSKKLPITSVIYTTSIGTYSRKSITMHCNLNRNRKFNSMLHYKWTFKTKDKLF